MKKFISIITLLTFILTAFAPVIHADTALTYDYDANGNLIQGDGKYYEYNNANKLVKVRYGDANGLIIAEYHYDYNGQRIKKVENGVTTYYIGKHTVTEVSESGTKSTKYYFANNERVAQRDNAGNLTFYHSDHLGGTNAVTDSSGNLVDRTKYYPFGEIRIGGNERFTFTGKEKDQVTDQYYFEARYYNPELKHFTQADTLVKDLYDPQNLNRYAYVRNNPLRYIDPTGHVWWNPFTWFKNKIQSTTSNSQTKSTKNTNLSTVPLPGSYAWDKLTGNSNNSVNGQNNSEKTVKKKGNDQYGPAHKFPSYDPKDSTKQWCTEYVASKYQVTWGGDAGKWLTNAEKQGYTTGDLPKEGAIVVTNESKWGHVAIVEKVTVTDKGSLIDLSESNWPGSGKYHTRTISAEDTLIKGYIYAEEHY